MFDYKVLTDYFDDNSIASKGLMIALVGAGGKTSTMYSLGRYFADKGARVVLTTTTKVLEPSANQVDEVLYVSCIEEEMSENGKVIFLGKYCDENGKVTGFEPYEAKGWNNDFFDILLYEADGAKRKPIKAPREGEPLIISGTSHVIGVIGLDALGTSVSETTVHRMGKFIDITGCAEGEIILVEHIKNLVMSDEGLFKNAPEGSIKILLLTKMDDAPRAKYADEIKHVLSNWKGIVLAI